MLNHRFFIPQDGLNQEKLTSEEIPELGDDWVLIKKKLTTNDFTKMQGKIIQYETLAKTRAEAQRMKIAGESPVKMSYNPDTAFLLSVAILDWSFMDETTQQKVPITVDSLGNMDPTLANLIQAQIDIRNPM